MSEFMYTPDNLNPVLWCIAVSLLIYPIFLLCRFIYRRQTVNWVNSHEETQSDLTGAARFMLKIKAGFVSIMAGIILMIIAGTIIMSTLEATITAKVCVVEKDNHAYSRQIFIWDKNYPEVDQTGNWVINRTDQTLVYWKLVKKNSHSGSLKRNIDYERLTSGKVIKVSVLPSRYYASLDQMPMIYSIIEGNADISTADVFDAM